MSIAPSEFWDMTIAEFWALYEIYFPPKVSQEDREAGRKAVEEFRAKQALKAQGGLK